MRSLQDNVDCKKQTNIMNVSLHVGNRRGGDDRSWSLLVDGILIKEYTDTLYVANQLLPSCFILFLFLCVCLYVCFVFVFVFFVYFWSGVLENGSSKYKKRMDIKRNLWYLLKRIKYILIHIYFSSNAFCICWF